MGCVYRPQTNALWSVWYCVLVLALNAYVFYLGITRYTAYTELRWPQGRPTFSMAVYIALHGFAITLVPFFIAAAGFKIGNFANDGEKLGAMGARRVFELSSKTAPCCRKLKSAWQHGPPVAQTLHLMIAFAILVAHAVMLAQLFKHGFLKGEDIWTTDDLDFLYNSAEKLNTIVPANSTLSLANVAPKLAPILLNAKLYGVSIEFLNYLIALLTFAIRYPAVFWHASKAFGFLFSCHLIVHTIEAVFTFISFNILYRLYTTGQIPDTLLRESFDGAPVAVHGSGTAFLLRNCWLLCGVYFSAFVLIFFASTLVYGYGYNKYCLSILLQQGRYRIRKSYPICCEGYSPHVVAIILLVLIVGAKAPVLYDLMVIYQHRSRDQAKILSCIVADVGYLFTWILLWLALTLKRDWAFKVRYSAQEILRLLGGDGQVLSAGGKEFKDTAAILLCGTETFVTDDPARKQALLNVIEKARLSQQESDIYWLRAPQQHNGSALPALTAPPARMPITQAPESAQLLDETQYATASLRRTYAQQPSAIKKQGYYKVSFDYDDEMRLDSSPAGVRSQRMRATSNASTAAQQAAAYANFEARTAPNAYARFQQQAHYESTGVDDPVTTFGTMPRSTARRQQRSLLHEQQQQGPVDYASSREVSHSRAGSEISAGMPSYAAVQKQQQQAASYGRLASLPPSGQQAGGQYVRLAEPESSDGHSNVSRASSYSNVPRQQQGWEPPQPAVHAGATYQSVPRGGAQRAGSYGSMQQAGTPPLAARSRPGAIPEGVPIQSVQQRQQLASTAGSPGYDRYPNVNVVYATALGGSRPTFTDTKNYSSMSDASSEYTAGGTLRSMTAGPGSSRETTPIGQYGAVRQTSFQPQPTNGSAASTISRSAYGQYQPQLVVSSSMGANGAQQPRKGSIQSTLQAAATASPQGSLTSPSSAASAPATSKLHAQHGGDVKPFGHHERNDSANFSLTSSSNESDKDQQLVTSVV